MATQLVSKPIVTDLSDFDAMLLKKKAPEREIWLYFLTVSACFAVVWGHVAAEVFLNAATPFQWWIGNFTDCLTRWCMTAFIMVSGYLLLNPAKQYTYAEFYKKRAGRILIPLIFWAFFFTALTAARHVFNGVPVTLSSFFTPILTGHPYYHLWYLYMLAGLYILTPFLKAGMRIVPSRWLTTICVMLFVIPTAVNTYSWFVLKKDFISDYPFIVWSLYFLGYYLGGYLIGKKTRIKTKTSILVIGLATSIIITALGCYVLKENFSLFSGLYFFSPLTPNVIVMTLLFFMLMKKLATPMRQNQYMETGNTLSFGIFLVHPFWIFVLGYLGLGTTKINPLVGIPVISMTTLVLSVITAILIQKIPYLRKVI